MDHLIAFVIFAQKVPDLEKKTSGGGAGIEPLLFLGGLLLFMYFILIRPQQKRAKKHKELVASLKRGDNVITTGGIYGRVVTIDDQDVTMEISKNTNIKVLRHFVGGRATEETEKQLSQNPPG